MHLFNISGYYMVFQYFIDRSETKIVRQLDKNQFNDHELIELKVALHLPYMNNSDYARIDGEIEIDGIHYNYVKRKVSNDTLYLLCLPNTAKTKLSEARNNYSSQAADLPSNNTSGKKSLVMYEYNQPVLAYHFNKPVTDAKQIGRCLTPQLISSYIDNSFHPPELV